MGREKLRDVDRYTGPEDWQNKCEYRSICVISFISPPAHLYEHRVFHVFQSRIRVNNANSTQDLWKTDETWWNPHQLGVDRPCRSWLGAGFGCCRSSARDGVFVEEVARTSPKSTVAVTTDGAWKVYLAVTVQLIEIYDVFFLYFSVFTVFFHFFDTADPEKLFISPSQSQDWFNAWWRQLSFWGAAHLTFHQWYNFGSPRRLVQTIFSTIWKGVPFMSSKGPCGRKSFAWFSSVYSLFPHELNIFSSHWVSLKETPAPRHPLASAQAMVRCCGIWAMASKWAAMNLLSKSLGPPTACWCLAVLAVPCCHPRPWGVVKPSAAWMS